MNRKERNGKKRVVTLEKCFGDCVDGVCNKELNSLLFLLLLLNA